MEDTPERRRELLAQQREESQRRLEAKRDEVIALKKAQDAARLEEKRKGASVDPSLVVKTTTQNLITSMKSWVRLPRAEPPPSADEISVNEKEIASLTVKLSALAPTPEIKKQLVDNIKQLLLRGKLAQQDPSEEKLVSLTNALKDVADVLKEYVTGKTQQPVGGSVLRLANANSRTASSPALQAPRPKVQQDLAQAPVADSPAVKRAPTSALEVLGAGAAATSSPAPTRRNPTLTESTPKRLELVAQAGPGSATPNLSRGSNSVSTPAVVTLSMVPSVPEGYDDGSPPPPASQDFATAMWEQRDKFPKLEVPWQLDYLCNQVALRGGCVSAGQLDPILGERKLAPYDITYACGNLSWVSEKDYLIPLSLLKRYLWHLPSSTIPDRQEALERVKEGSYSYEASQYVMDMPLHKRDVMGYLVTYIRKIGELRGSSDLQDVLKVFAPLVFRTSSNFNSRDNKMKIPIAMAEEIRFLGNLVRDLDVVALGKKGARERSRMSTRPNTVATATVPDVNAQRAMLKGWSTENELSGVSWAKLSATSIGNFKVLPGFQYEVGSNKVCPDLADRSKLELIHNQTLWYQDFFYGKPHFNVLVQEKEQKEGKSVNLAVVSVMKPPDGYVDPFPVQALVLLPDAGYVRVTVEVAPNKKKIADVKEVLAAVRTLPMVPNNAQIIHCENPKLCDALADFEQKTVVSSYKFGVLYQGPGQTTEEEMYNNMNGSANYNAFLDLIGEKVTLSKHKGFRGGLECQGNNSTGEFSVYTKMFFSADGSVVQEETNDGVSLEIMWHVGTYLPDTGEVQQLQRKRHLGNDLVIVVFSESDVPFDPTTFASQFNHVWIVVSKQKTGYSLSVVTKTGVKPIRPFVSDVIPAASFRDFFLLKCVNAERAAMFAKDFKGKETRTRLKMFEHWESSFLEEKHEKASWGSSFVTKLSESSTSLFSSLFSGDQE